MPKPKGGGGGGVAAEAGEEKSDGLEIISIGSLYDGPWDKKYWSSSRGKDRYPYPVGYQARRAYGESNCKMEIHEGPQGPLFMITSADGHSGSGQTPDMAWDKFQKKGFPHTKIWHGKRFSCKTDGVEFFGFKNPFVQRLLRELVANVNGIAECNLLSSSCCNGATVTEHKSECPDSCRQPDLLVYLARAEVTAKRSKRDKITNPRSSSIAGFKRLRPGDSTSIFDASNSMQRKYEEGSPLPSSSFDFKEQVSCGPTKSKPAASVLKSVAADTKMLLPAKVGSPCKSVSYSNCSGHEPAPNLEEGDLASSKTCKGNSTNSNMPAGEKHLDRSKDTEMEGSSFKTFVEDKARDAPASKDSQGVQDVDLCAPDTLDFSEDSAPNLVDKDTCDVTEELIRNNEVIFEGLITESHPDVEIGVSNSNSYSEKSDLDSVGQDIAKSMITVLLPQAIPLLKGTSHKKKKSISLPENLPGSPKSHETSEMGHPTEFKSAGVYHSAVLDSELKKSVIHDSFDDQCFDHAVNRLMLPSKDGEYDLQWRNEDAYPPCIREHGDLLESSVSHFETDESKDIFCHNEAQSAVIKQPQPEADLVPKIQSEEKDPKSPTCNKVMATRNAKQRDTGASEKSLQKDLLIEAGAIKKDNLLETQVPRRVYTRKKVTNAASTAGKCNASLSESIICRNPGDGCLQELTGTSVDSAAFWICSSLGEKQNNNLVNLETEVVQQFSDVCDAKSNNMNSVAPSFEGKDALNHVHSSSNEEPQHQFKERELEDKKVTDISDELLPWEHETAFCHNKTSGTTDISVNLDVPLNRDVKLNNELHGHYELVGCYIHPFTVSSLLLSTNGTDIVICALCGVSMDKITTLFLYKLSLEKPRIGIPSFIGHTPITLPSSTDMLDREIVYERSSLQLTPDGQCLVMLSSTKAPCCREGNIACLCSSCTSDRFDNTSVKIVQVKVGYVSVLVKLRAGENFKCLLVCEPNHLTAAGESGRLHVWVMNSSWSASTEEIVMPAKYEIHSSTVELKRIPKCSSLVVGHNGFGEFLLWDISKRILLSRFSAPSSSVCQFFPISAFSWQQVPGFNNSGMEDNANCMLDATNLWFSEPSENHSFPQLEGEDPAIWLLVSTASTCDAQPVSMPNDCQRHRWRLALMVKNVLLLGSALDPRAAAIGASSGHGLIGTLDGQVYVWELLSGSKLGTLHDFKGGSVSCIAAEDSKLGVLAVADETGQLLVYQHLQRYAF